ncbi:DNA polymerase III PolC [Streptococcus pneumoniae]|nr:DNA polymerase III PolC [Streptococcus pneumoniae]
MKLRIFAEDKPAKKVFEYQLELADRTILLSTAAIALAGIFSALREK